MADEGPKAALAALEERVRASEFQRWAGLELVSLSEGSAEFALDLLPYHRNLRGGIHGGLLAILADTATGVAMHAAVGPERTHVTVQLDLHFVGQAATDRITATGRVLRAGRRIGFAEARITDGEGTLVALASATSMISEASPGGGESGPGQ